MKTQHIIYILVFFFCVFSAKAQKNVILLHPSVGQQYVYEFQDVSYRENGQGQKSRMIIKKKNFKICYTVRKADNKKYLIVNMIKNTIEDPLSNSISFKDYEYPEFRDGFYDERDVDFYEGLLCRVTFQYEFETKNSQLKLVNRVEILEEIREFLNEKGFDKEEINERIEIINQQAFKEVTSLLESIYRIDLAKSGDEILQDSEFQTKRDSSNAVLSIIQTRLKNEIGLLSRKVTIDKNGNNLTDYSSVEMDTLRGTFRKGPAAFRNKYTKQIIQLVSSQKVVSDQFTLTGSFENTDADRVTLAILEDPYGDQLRQETVFLNKSHSFKIDTQLKHAGLVFLQIGKYKYDGNPPMLCFYAQPGSEMHFDAIGNKYPWEITFSGDFNGAAKMLYEFRTKHNIFDERINFNMIQPFYLRSDTKDFIYVSKEFDKIAHQYKNQMDVNAFEFVTRELKAYLFNGLFQFYSQMNFSRNYPTINIYFPGQDDINFTELKSVLDTFKLYKTYNNYGIYSRNVARAYLLYNVAKMQKVKELSFGRYRVGGINANFYFSYDLDLWVQLSRTVLVGHALYSQLVQLFSDELRKEDRLLNQDKSFIRKKIDDYLDLMIRRCNNNEFVAAVKDFRRNNLKWQSGNYVPDIKFLNPEGDSTSFKDFFGEKPTVFYITTDWTVERYYWDKMAEDNPGLNVVLVTEGSNFKEWKDYLKKADPVTHQLILINSEKSLLDVFFSNLRYYIAYDKNGKLLGTSNDAKKIVELGKKSLNSSKKQFDKSQLKIIISILIVSLLILFIIMLYWKWRVRQRFRKEEQKRRLRELELTAIRSQMNPHFLFNSLNSVQNLVQQNKGREAHLYLADFAGLIRKVLQNSEKEEVSLAEELEMVKQYLSLEKLRFDFDYSFFVDKRIDANNTMIPSMLLQPFAENAVIHGLQNKTGNRQLKIEVTREEAGIKISIEDNGIGREAAKEISRTKNGKGSKLMKERLEILQQKQGEDYHLEIIDVNKDGETGTRVVIYIPEEN